MILITGILSLPSCRYFERWGFFSNRSLKKALLWAKQDSTRVADSLKRIAIFKNSAKVIVQDSLEPDRYKNNSVESIKNKYHIIVGSFTNAENARLREREYFSKGYKPDLISTTGRSGNKIELVSVRSFENFPAANEFLKAFKRDIDSTAWVYSHN